MDMFEKIGEMVPDNLVAGHEVPQLVKGVTLAKGNGVLVRGTVLGIVTASELAVPVDSSKSDGSEVADCILTDTVDTGDETAQEDVKATAYTSGLFNRKALTFGGEDTASEHELWLRELGIHLKDNVEY